jgi:hypothetical protein
MTSVEQQNRKLAECLGSRGGQQWWKWAWAPDLTYFWRRSLDAAWERHCWAETLGKVWVLCQFRPPEISREEWNRGYKGELPYPERGRYYPHGETAIYPPGREPSMEDTVFYIRTLAEQDAKGEVEHLNEAYARAQNAQDQVEKDFMYEAEEQFPAFWRNGQGHVPGTRGAHVSIGGV